jgi:hypothetical protein
MRIWIKGEPCMDREPIQAYIMDLEKEIVKKDKEIERLKALLLKQEDIFKVKNNLCRCCGAIMSDEEKCTHNCNKEPIIRN